MLVQKQIDKHHENEARGKSFFMKNKDLDPFYFHTEPHLQGPATMHVKNYLAIALRYIVFTFLLLFSYFAIVLVQHVNSDSRQSWLEKLRQTRFHLLSDVEEFNQKQNKKYYILESGGSGVSAFVINNEANVHYYPPDKSFIFQLPFSLFNPPVVVRDKLDGDNNSGLVRVSKHC